MYKELAFYYDLFMSDTNYIDWAEYLAGFLAGKKQGMDLGCGSGKLTIELFKRGFDLSGLDLSQQMLAQAYRNARDARLGITFVCQDMQALHVHKEMDFFLSSCDGVNYIRHPQSFFSRVFSYLKKDGIFLFDISSAYKLKNILANNTFSETRNDITYIWSNQRSRRGDAIDMELTFFEREGDCYRKTQERQRQYVHEKANVLTALKEAGFRCVTTYRCFSYKRDKATDERIQFVAIK